MKKLSRQDAAKFNRLRDPAQFRRVVKIDMGPNRAPRLASECHDCWQRADFEAIDPAWRRLLGQDAGAEGPQRAYFERPRGHSKTSDLALQVTHALTFSPRRLSGVVAAADKDQAKLLRDAISTLIALNPELGEFLEVQTYRVVNPHTQSSLRILSSDASTSYGITPDFVIIDELTHWENRDLWDSLISAAAKREHCLVLCISNAGFMSSWQWSVREQIRIDPDWHFSCLDGPQASWISEKRLAEQRRINPPIYFARLWLNQWTAGSGDALDPEIVNVATKDFAPLTAPEDGWVYSIGVDLGVVRDATAVCVIGKHVGHYEKVDRKPEPEPLSRRAMRRAGLLPPLIAPTEEVFVPGSGRLKLADLRIWQPTRGQQVQLAEVEAKIIEMHNRFGAVVYADPHQMRPIEQRLLAAGVPCELVNFTDANLRSMASLVLSAFNDRQIDLFRDDRLDFDLKALRIVERPNGIRLESPKGSSGQGTPHGDAATALELAILGASNCHGPRRPPVIEGPLCYPHSDNLSR